MDCVEDSVVANANSITRALPQAPCSRRPGVVSEKCDGATDTSALLFF